MSLKKTEIRTRLTIENVTDLIVIATKTTITLIRILSFAWQGTKRNRRGKNKIPKKINDI